MKKINLLLLALLCLIIGASGQCTIDTVYLSSDTSGGVYPADSLLPHITQNVAYDQTVQGKIQSTIDTTVIAFTFVVTVDSVRMDSITGLPAGITFTKNPNVILGGGYGCVEFTGTTSSPAGTYPLTAYGTAWGEAYNSTVGTEPATYTGNLNNFSPFGGYYLVVDSQSQTSAPTVTVIGHSPLCSGGLGSAVAVATGGNGTYTYLWSSNGATTDSISGLTANTYTVTVTSNSLTVTGSATIVIPSAITGSFGTQNANCDSEMVTIHAANGTPPYTYSWTTGSTDTTTTVLPNLEYTVTITDAHSCFATDSGIFVCTGIASTGAGNIGLHLYPNPASTLLHLSLQLNVATVLQLKIYDLTGQVMYAAKQDVQGILNTDINVQNFAPGAYFMEVTGNNQTGNNQTGRERFIIER